MVIPSFTNNLLNKSLVSAVFPDDAELNLSAVDMGEGMFSINFDSEAIERLKVAFGTVGSPNLAIDVSVDVQISKITAAADIWNRRGIKETRVRGTQGMCVITDDMGKPYTLYQCTVSKTSFTANGTEAHYGFSLKGVMATNEDLFGKFEVS